MDEVEGDPGDKGISSTESLRANCAQSVSSNDVENISFDHDSLSVNVDLDIALETKYIPVYEDFYKQANRRGPKSHSKGKKSLWKTHCREIITSLHNTAHLNNSNWLFRPIRQS